MKESFVTIWREKVEKVAQKCSPIEVFNLIKNIESDTYSEEEKNKFAQQLQNMNFKDINAVWYIGLMIGDIQKGIFDNRGSLNLINSVSQVTGCLNSESYWSNVWNNDITSDESKNLKELASLMSDLVRYL